MYWDNDCITLSFVVHKQFSRGIKRRIQSSMKLNFSINVSRLTFPTSSQVARRLRVLSKEIMISRAHQSSNRRIVRRWTIQMIMWTDMRTFMVTIMMATIATMVSTMMAIMVTMATLHMHQAKHVYQLALQLRPLQLSQLQKLQFASKETSWQHPFSVRSTQQLIGLVLLILLLQTTLEPLSSKFMEPQVSTIYWSSFCGLLQHLDAV